MQQTTVEDATLSSEPPSGEASRPSPTPTRSGEQGTNGTGPAAPPSGRRPRLPPRWFVRSFWAGHRAVYRASGGRRGLKRPTPTEWGMLCLHTIGRRTGEERLAILGYYEDGANLVTLAMNGWAAPEPAWWLNLQAHPDAAVDLVDGPRLVRGRAAEGEERDRLWAHWQDLGDDVDAYSTRRPTETAVVVLEPRTEDAP